MFASWRNSRTTCSGLMATARRPFVSPYWFILAALSCGGLRDEDRSWALQECVLCPSCTEAVFTAPDHRAAVETAYNRSFIRKPLCTMAAKYFVTALSQMLLNYENVFIYNLEFTMHCFDQLTKTRSKKKYTVFRASWFAILHIQHYFHITILHSSNMTNKNLLFTVFSSKHPYTYEHMYFVMLPVNLTIPLPHGEKNVQWFQ